MKRVTRWTVMIVLVMLAACTSDKDNADQLPGASATPGPVAWQRSLTAISQETFAQVRLTGMMRLHQQTVNGVAFSNNGTRLASVGADGTTVVWNLANGESLFVRGDTDGRRVFWGPGDETVVTVSRDGLARVWVMNIAPPRELEEATSFAGYDGMATVVVQSSDHTLMAFGGQTGGIRMWRVPDGDMVADISAPGQTIQHLAFSPDGTLLASVNADQTVKVWSVPDGALVYDLTDPAVLPLHTVFSPDSHHLAIANRTGFQLWDTASGERVYSVSAADNAVANTLAFSPDGTLLAGCGMQSLVGIWEATTGTLLGGLPLPGQTCSNLAFSPDSRLLLTLPYPGRDVYLWDILHITDDVPAEDKQMRRRDRQNMGLFPGTQFYDMAWSGDGRFIVLLDNLGPLYVLSAAD